MDNKNNLIHHFLIGQLFISDERKDTLHVSLNIKTMQDIGLILKIYAKKGFCDFTVQYDP